MKRSWYVSSAVRFGRVILFGSAIATAAAGCGGGGGATSGQSYLPTDPASGGSKGTSGSLSITVANNSYNPGSTTVPRGSTVHWTWDTCDMGYSTETCTTHTVTFDDAVSSGMQDKGSYSRTFPNAGTYAYHCKVHGTAMSGTVIVQ